MQNIALPQRRLECDIRGAEQALAPVRDFSLRVVTPQSGLKAVTKRS